MIFSALNAIVAYLGLYLSAFVYVPFGELIMAWLGSTSLAKTFLRSRLNKLDWGLIRRWATGPSSRLIVWSDKSLPVGFERGLVSNEWQANHNTSPYSL